MDFILLEYCNSKNLLQKMYVLSEVKVLVNVPFVQTFYLASTFIESLHIEAFEIPRKMSKFTKNICS